MTVPWHCDPAPLEHAGKWNDSTPGILHGVLAIDADVNALMASRIVYSLLDSYSSQTTGMQKNKSLQYN